MKSKVKDSETINEEIEKLINTAEEKFNTRDFLESISIVEAASYKLEKAITEVNISTAKYAVGWYEKPGRLSVF
ncbi:MAG: hypothetical protein ACOZCL_14920 [Bacillota bacterium]